MTEKLRSVFMTINNHTDADIELAKSWTTSWTAIGYHVGEESKITHIHIASQFKTQKLFSTIKKRFPTANIQKLQSKEKKSIVEYLSKYEKKLLFESGEFKAPQPGFRTDIADWRSDVETGLSHRKLVANHPSLYMRYMRNASAMEKVFKPKKKKKIYNNFNRPLVDDFTKPLVLTGPTGLGKTQYAKACLPEAIFCSHIDELVDEDLSGGIIFDDMDFQHWPRNSQIHLVDQEEDRAIHVRYTILEIPADTRKIFTTNNHPFLYDPAIDRRINVVEIKKQLY